MPDPIPWVPVRQHLEAPEIADPEAGLARALAASPATGALAGRRVAVPVGSRAVCGLAGLVRCLVAHLRSAGADPFVVPAMGTHGGATPEGQEQTLGDLGVTPGTVGAPVVSRPEVVRAGETPSGIAVWCGRSAWEADLIVPLHRVKPHTAFRGPLESGPAKLLAVGLGKERSARELHRRGLARGVPEVLAFWLGSGKVPFGVALVENARHRVARLEVLEPRGWLEAEARLLELARDLFPRLPWDELDLLVVERIGKDISGTGMDLNVIGMERRFPGCGATPRIARIVALDLTDASHGNANGVGYADVVTRRLEERMDREATYANARATGFLEAARLPMVAAGEREAVEIALESLRLGPDEVRAVRIRDTAHLERLRVSPALARRLPQGVHKTCG